jgi:hypothetical protein
MGIYWRARSIVFHSLPTYFHSFAPEVVTLSLNFVHLIPRARCHGVVMGRLFDFSCFYSALSLLLGLKASKGMGFWSTEHGGTTVSIQGDV